MHSARPSTPNGKRAALVFAIGGLAAGGVMVAPSGVASAATVDVKPGMEIQIQHGGGDGSLCTLAFTGTKGADKIGFTAGHCGKVGERVFSGSTEIGVFSDSKSPTMGPNGEIMNANEPDWAVVKFTSNANVMPSSEQVAPTSAGEAKTGDKVCSQGRTTGWACGEVTGVSGTWVMTSINRDRGDSGGPLIRTSDNAALGILSSIDLNPGGSPGGAVSRYFSLPEAVKQSGAQLGTVGDSAGKGAVQPRNVPAPSEVTPAPLPRVAMS